MNGKFQWYPIEKMAIWCTWAFLWLSIHCNWYDRLKSNIFSAIDIEHQLKTIASELPLAVFGCIIRWIYKCNSFNSKGIFTWFKKKNNTQQLNAATQSNRDIHIFTKILTKLILFYLMLSICCSALQKCIYKFMCVIVIFGMFFFGRALWLFTLSMHFDVVSMRIYKINDNINWSKNV